MNQNILCLNSDKTDVLLIGSLSFVKLVHWCYP